MKHRSALSCVVLAVLIASFGRAVQAATITGTTTLTYAAGAGVNNNLSVTIVTGNFVFNDTGETITTSITGSSGSGTNTVMVPTTGVTAIILTLADGADTISASGVVLAAQTLTITHTGTGLTISGPLTTTTTALSVTNSGTGDLTLNGAVSTTTGAITLSSNNNLFQNANVAAGSTGTITLKANQDGAGTDGYTQKVGATLTTTNTGASAISITVNTAGGGTGNCNINSCSAGSASTLTIAANGGSILNNSGDALTAAQIGTTNGGAAPAHVLTATNYTFTVTGAGSIGTTAIPIESTNVGSDASGGSTFKLNAGDGGAFLTDWGTVDVTVGPSSATGPGSIRIVSANASGHNMFVTGNVSAVNGNIYLAADDNLSVTGATTVIGGASFTGTVWMQGNRDVSSLSQFTSFASTCSILTSSTANQAVALSARTPTTQAVYMDIGGGTAAGTNLVTVGNITTGDGGRVVLNGSSQLSAAQSGSITMAAATNVIHVGATGTLELDAILQSTTGADNIGTAAIPIKVDGGSVVVNSQFGNVWVTSTGPVNSNTNFTANFSTISGQTTPPTLNLATTAGTLTINGSTTIVNGGTINLTSTGTGGGVLLNAPLGNAATGAVSINSGANPLTLNANFALSNAQAVSVAASSVIVSPGVTLAGTWGAGSTSPVVVQAGGTLSPGDLANTATGTLNMGSLTIGSGSTFRADFNSNASFDSLNVTTGAVNIAGSTLQLFIDGPITSGTSFTLISNGGGSAVVGQFTAGTTITAANDPGFVFNLNYAGGASGHDVVATVQDTTILDVTGGVMTCSSIPGLNNTLTVTRSGANYVINDPSTAITLSANAVAASWTGNGANTVTGPIAGITNLTLRLNDGADTIAGIDAGAASVNIVGFSTINVIGLVSTTSTIGVSGITDLTMSGAGMLSGTTLTLTTSNSMGTSLQPILTQATAIVASTGPGSMFITEADGSDVTASASGTGNVTIVNLLGTLNVAGTVSTVSGNISLSSADDITINANVNSGTGTVTIAANTDGNGAGSVTQNATNTISTITSASAVNITVNTAGGGTGNANLRTIACTAGTLTVNTNGGSILYAGVDALDIQQAALTTLAPGITGPAPSGTGQGGTGASPAGTINALNYSLTATGSGSIGTAARPLQTFTPAGNTEALSAGSGGIYFVDWGNPLTLNSATATGAGSVVVVAANAGGHNMTVAGNVTTGSGNIVLAADDDFIISAGVTVGGAGFSGDVYLACNRDTGNTATLTMSGAVLTANNTASAVVVEAFHAAGNGTNNSNVTINNITCGDGGTITLSTVPSSLSSGQGSIAATSAASVLNAGPTGTVKFIATTIASTSVTITAAVGASALPMTVTAGNVVVTANTGTFTGLTAFPDSVFITDTIAGNFTVTTGSTSPSGNINLTTTSGALTINGATNTGNSNAITLNGASGVVLNATLGSATTGVISITGPLSGTGNIVEGTGAVSITQNADSVYSGSISGNQPVSKAGTGKLTLSAASSSYSALTSATAGSLVANSDISTSTGVQITQGASVRGTGKVNAITTAVGTGNPVVWPGNANSVTSLTTNENLTGSTANLGVNAGKLDIVISNANNVAQSLTLTGSLTLDTTSVLSLAFDTGIVGRSYTIVTTATGGISTAFGSVLGISGYAGDNVPHPTSVDVIYTDGVLSYFNPTLGSTLPTTVNQIKLSFNAGVTPVTLENFRVSPQGAGVLIEWTAHAEFRNAGFTIWRRNLATDGGSWECITPTPIAGRLSTVQAKEYSFYDWPAPGIYSYRLKTLDLHGVVETFAKDAGPLELDAFGVPPLGGPELDAFVVPPLGGIAYSVLPNVGTANVALDAATESVLAHSVSAHAQSLLASVARSLAQSIAPTPVKGELASVATFVVPPLGGSVRAIPPKGGTTNTASAFPRWFTSSAASAGARASTAAKVASAGRGVLRVPFASLPPGFNPRAVSIQREGRAVNVLALTQDSLILFAPGYADDYTNADAHFLFASNAPTSAGNPVSASGLFDSPLTPARTTQKAFSADFHDVYFEWSLRPYTYAPWFSNQYLRAGASAQFTLDTPNASDGPASLTVSLYSAGADGAPVPHVLDAFVNGVHAGSSQWTTTAGAALGLAFQLPAGTLHAGSNSIQLMESADASSSAIELVHSLSLSCTVALAAPAPLEFSLANAAPQLVEVSGLPSAGAWIVDARYDDRAALLPAEYHLDADGTYRVRFNAPAGGARTFLVVPIGQELAPLAISKRTLKPVQGGLKYLSTGPAQFSSAVQPLLAAHSKEGLRAAFVDQEQLFDYYNYGRYGPDGIRNAIRSTRPPYLLLLGRTTYDARNYGGMNTNPLCPTYYTGSVFWSNAPSDSSYGDLGRGFPEVRVGRLPATNADELRQMVAHTLNYRGLSASGWSAELAADRADPAAADFPAVAAGLAATLPSITWQIDALGVSTQSAADVTEQMRAAACGGADLVMYVGHGNSARLGAQVPRILDADSIQTWTGDTVLVLATCAGNWFAGNDYTVRSIAMQGLSQPQGGIAASFGTTTYSTATVDTQYMRVFLSQAQIPGARWGDALLRAQQWSAAQSAPDASEMSKTQCMLGDPALPVNATQPVGAQKTAPGSF
ncbi:MAG TPA: C25 family cysteine peptidase [Planctomycetota bacterium]|nr:C25 family cysteine peptidase [Planctomycetota bacterium]